MGKYMLIEVVDRIISTTIFSDLETAQEKLVEKYEEASLKYTIDVFGNYINPGKTIAWVDTDEIQCDYKIIEIK